LLWLGIIISVIVWEYMGKVEVGASKVSIFNFPPNQKSGVLVFLWEFYKLVPKNVG
jgi:hypothetical protein